MHSRDYPHLTASVLVADQDRILMVNEIDNGIRVWNQPAGHVEVGEDLQTAAIREALEESRYQVQLTHLLGLYQNVHEATGIHYLRACFIANAVTLVENAVLDADILQADWLPLNALLAGDYPLRSPIVRQCLLDFQAGQRFPLNCIQPMLSLSES
ncbi:NUDIX domain-containing protein [Saccharospirillum mangrovi]|uniref:NUDIX domain-containing protein n=1 Tax=Saccharospirillum mangrovi TaxID=2161747 RepID=UPI000D3B92A7|nr:NUDIX domain-containing protein [Saccharospirillum mangrovi]